jgi:hypothetical protein
MKEFFQKLYKTAGLYYASLFALAVSLTLPGNAFADGIADAITDWDTTDLIAAGAAVITFVMVIVGIKKVIQLIKSA